MNREIKFRVWEKGTKNLLGYEYFNTPLNNGFFYTDLSELKEGETEEDLFCHSEFHDPPMLKPKKLNQLLREEYTSKKDMDGNEIYEGDIVGYSQWNTSTGDSPSGNNGWHNGEVYFNEGKFLVKGNEAWDTFQYMNLKVIGNIHQNPELIL